MTDASTKDFVLKRHNGITWLCRSLAAGAMGFHRICLEGGEYLPREGPALLLPKHRAYRDIFLEGVLLYRVARRYGNYVMKVGLYGALEILGGVKIVRPKDVRRLEDRQARKAQIQWAREKNQITLDYLTWLYGRGEIVVSHPEGMRFQDSMGAMQKEVVEHMLQAEGQLGLEIPIIPVGLEYENYRRLRSRVYFRVGEPIYSSHFADVGELMNAIDERIRSLSGFCAVEGKKV